MRRSPVWIALPVAAAALGAGAPPAEDEARLKLQEVEAAKAEQAIASEAAAARASKATATALQVAKERADVLSKLRSDEQDIIEIAGRIDALALSRRDAEQRAEAHRDAVLRLLPLAERMTIYPTETLLGIPASPETTLRAKLVLKGLIQALQHEAERATQDQARLEAMTRALSGEKAELATAEAAQTREAAELDRQLLVAKQTETVASADAIRAANRTARTAAQAEMLRHVLDGLEGERRANEAKAQDAALQTAPKSTAQAHARERATGPDNAKLEAPVAGIIVTGWGDETDSGPATGLSYRASPRARVVSPCGGSVVFADAFRSFGLLVIIDCGNGIHVVMSGFDRLSVGRGQAVGSGDPVGVMPYWEPGSTARRPALYVELRRDGRPINPLPWLKSPS